MGDTGPRFPLPRLSVQRRREMLAAPREPKVYAEFLGELEFLDNPEVGSPPRALSGAPDTLRVVCWNAERGRHLGSAERLLLDTKPDVVLLSELDCGMARSSQLHTGRELARRLGCGYVYGVEFLELGLGDEKERAQHAGDENEIGYHGGAILSPHPLARPAVLRLETSGRWFDGALGERRVGGRIAVVAVVSLAGVDVAFASVHLESHSDPAERCAEFERLLDFLDDVHSDGPILIGGDVNTSSLSVSHLRDRDLLRAALAEDPERLMNPVPHEPLFALAERRGYDWRRCNLLDTSTHRTQSGRGRLRLDWLFTRQLDARDPQVIAAVDPETGQVLSDHEALAVSVRLRGREEA